MRFVPDVLQAVPARKRFRVLVRSVSLLFGITGAFVASILLEKGQYWWSGLPAFIVLVATFAEFVLGDILTDRRYPARTALLLERLETKLQLCSEQIGEHIDRAIDSLQGCDRGRVSGTFHLVVDLYSPIDEEPEPAFFQVIDYAGRQIVDRTGKPKPGRWRFTSISKGIIGRCLRTNMAEHVNFSTEDELRERMVREFGFSRSEMEERSLDARSYWSQPVFHEDKVIGVLFFFSTEIQVFPKAIDEVATTKLEPTAQSIRGLLETAQII